MAKDFRIEDASKTASTLLTLFIPSVDRNSQEIEQPKWVQEALELLGSIFGGATAFPKGRGVWRDDQQGGRLVFDETVVIHCYSSIEALENHRQELIGFLKRLGAEANQGAVGFVVDQVYIEFAFPKVEQSNG